MTSSAEVTTALAESGPKKNRGEHLAAYRFKPGVSPNPGGRPKGTTLVELKAAARANIPLAIERLAELMKSRDENIAMQAVQFVYLYAFGKPQEGRDLAHVEAMQARHQELVAIPAERDVPELEPPSTEPAPPALDAAVAAPAPSLTTTALPEPAAAQVVVPLPASVPSGLRCLYRGKDGQCTDSAADGAQWCAPHRAKLFSMVNQ